ncbi:hypothetical protein NCCP2716_16800 [Sporosarcina sp. NCCP-2716]|uniref:hypothetical protein n=1 Tax=Sporosarcina sp. NCCP-2716 TaxID=2943679 RepID=UPI00203C827D|nr:hypothetical protein [Sporosarcina sp. NCCP-2716]GKV69182.1 hypothetical protein NCCP2716_16800 [Sporosarcina sp. NCCP-2716]
MPKSMVVYIPDLRAKIQDKGTVMYEMLGGDWPDIVPGSPGLWSLHLEDVTFSSAFFHYIAIDCNTNRMTFLRYSDDRFRIGDAVRSALKELEIDDFTPCSLSYWAHAPGWRRTEGQNG